MELTEWCTRKTKRCAPLQKGLARTLVHTLFCCCICTLPFYCQYLSDLKFARHLKITDIIVNIMIVLIMSEASSFRRMTVTLLYCSYWHID